MKLFSKQKEKSIRALLRDRGRNKKRDLKTQNGARENNNATIFEDEVLNNHTRTETGKKVQRFGVRELFVSLEYVITY